MDDDPREKGSSFGRIVGVFTSPASTFRSITEKPTWVVPWLVLLVAQMVPTFMAIPKFDWEAIARANVERMEMEITDEQLERQVEASETAGPIFAYLAPITWTLGYLLFALSFWVVFSLAGGDLTFAESWSVTLHGLLPYAVAGILAIPVVASLGTIGPELAEGGSFLSSNLSFLADEDTGVVFRTLLASLDLFTVWSALLLAVGFRFVARVSAGIAGGVVGGLWALWIGTKIGLASLGQLFGG